MRSLLAIVAVLAVLAPVALGINITISNVIPHRDTDGVIMDVHDGNVMFMNGTYYYYGASYGLCLEPSGESGCTGAAPGSCGFRLNHNVSLWTSKDLSAWTPHPPVFQMTDSGIPGGILFCPKIVYNKRTTRFVMWFNWIEGSDFSHSYYGVAMADTPYGPFKVVNKQVSTLAYEDTGDMALFVDDDGTGYVIYTSHIVGGVLTHRMSVEQLTPDFAESLGAKANSGFFGAPYVEAPTMFKRNGIYYTVFGATCCYCAVGTAVYIHTATHPLGPYATQNSIGAERAEIVAADDAPHCSPRQGRQASLIAAAARRRSDGPIALKQQTQCTQEDRSAGKVGITTIPAQQTDIMMYMSSDGPQWMWRGDRWQSAPDRLKAHDFTYWNPLTFLPDGNVTAMAWQDSFEIDVAVQP